MCRPLPVAAGIAVDRRCAALCGALRPREFWTVDDGLSCQHHVFCHGNGTRRTHEVAAANGILGVAILLVGRHTVLHPSARVEADAIAACKAAEPGTQTVALVIEEVFLLRVLLEAEEMLWTAAQEAADVAAPALHVGHRHLVCIVVGVGKTDGQIAAVRLAQGQQAGEEPQPIVEGHAPCLVESPVLFGKVEAQEVGVLLVVFLVGRHIIGRVGQAVGIAAGTLYHGPYAVLCAHLHPRVVDGRSVGRLLVARRGGDVEDDERTDILRHHVDDLLRVGIVPHIDVNQPRRLFR